MYSTATESLPRFRYGPATRIDSRHWQSGAPMDLRELPRAGVQAVVLCCMPGEYTACRIRDDIHVPGLLVLRAPIDDAEIDRTIVRTVQNAADWVVTVLGTGRRVLITCMAGRNRSGLVSALVLMKRHGISGDEAVARVQALRKDALTNESFAEYVRSKA